MDFLGDTEAPFSITTSWFHALTTPLRLCVRLARLKWRSLFGEAECLYEGLGKMVGPSADQLEWARWEVLEYFQDSVIECFDGMTVVEAADALDRATGTVKSHLHRALKTLRRELADLWEENR